VLTDAVYFQKLSLALETFADMSVGRIR